MAKSDKKTVTIEIPAPRSADERRAAAAARARAAEKAEPGDVRAGAGMNAGRAQDFITEARNDARAFWEAYQRLRAKQDEWNALDYGNTLPDGGGANAGYTADDVGAVVFGTANAVKAVMDAGHATNVSQLL